MERRAADVRGGSEANQQEENGEIVLSAIGEDYGDIGDHSRKREPLCMKRSYHYRENEPCKDEDKSEQPTKCLSGTLGRLHDAIIIAWDDARPAPGRRSPSHIV